MAPATLAEFLRAADPEQWLQTCGAFPPFEIQHLTESMRSVREHLPQTHPKDEDSEYFFRPRDIRHAFDEMYTTESNRCLTNIHNQLLLPLTRYADVSILETSIFQYPWLKDFHEENNFEGSLAALREDSNATTITLMKHLEHFAGITLHSLWRELCELFVPDPEYSRSCEKLEDDEALSLLIALPEMHNDSYWKGVCSRVRDFCLSARCPRADANPFEAITALRTMIMQMSGPNTETLLRAEMEELREQVRKQSRIITGLSYRHLFEHLPGSALNSQPNVAVNDQPSTATKHKPNNAIKGKSNTSSTDRWQDFWTRELAKAAKIPTHPLNGLLQRFPNNVNQIKKVGSTLYGTLSANIHDFQGTWVVDTSLWHAQEGAILQALTPVNVKSDGTVDWEQERQRY